jgi:hypothetical protein
VEELYKMTKVVWPKLLVSTLLFKLILVERLFLQWLPWTRVVPEIDHFKASLYFVLMDSGGPWTKYSGLPEGKFLVRDKPRSKLITFSYLIRRELFSTN